MTRPLKKMPTPLGVAAGAIASVALPIGLTYHRLYIVMEADLGAGPVPLPADEWENHVEEIRVMVNGDAQIIIDAKDLVALNAYHGMPDQEGTLALYLSQPWMRTANGEDQTAYGTVGLASFTLEIDLKEGISSPKLEVYAVQSPGTAYGMHLRVQKYTVPQGLEGERQIADIMRGNYGMLALHVNSDKVGDIEVHADQRKVLESTKVVRAAHLTHSGRVAQAGYTHIDLVSENRLIEAMPMALADFRLTVDFEEAGNFVIYAVSVQGA